MIEAAYLGIMTLLSAIDIKTRIIPNWLVIPASVVFAALLHNLFPCVVMLMIASLFFKDDGSLSGAFAIGGGDIKVMVLVASMLGWASIAVFATAAICVKLYRRILDKHDPVPFVPFILFSSVFVLFVTKANILFR